MQAPTGDGRLLAANLRNIGSVLAAVAEQKAARRASGNESN